MTQKQILSNVVFFIEEKFNQCGVSTPFNVYRYTIDGVVSYGSLENDNIECIKIGEFVPDGEYMVLRSTIMAAKYEAQDIRQVSKDYCWMFSADPEDADYFPANFQRII
jgi:hypothetical protein